MAIVLNTASLVIDVDLGGEKPAVVLSGEANHSNISHVVDLFDKLACENHGCVTLDLDRVEHIDSAAIEGFASSAGSFIDRGRRIHINKVNRNVWRTLDRHLLGDLFCVNNGECLCDPRKCGCAKESWAMDVFSLPCDLLQCREARERVGRVAELVGFSHCYQQDIMLAVGEAVTNAVRYAYVDETSTFTVSCLATPEKLSITVTDSGPGFDMEMLLSFEEALFLEHGRGVHCMKALMDEVHFTFDRGTTVRMVKVSG